jgi:hypothetical protein
MMDATMRILSAMIMMIVLKIGAMLLLDAKPLLFPVMMVINVLLIHVIANLDVLTNRLNAMIIMLVPMTLAILLLDVFPLLSSAMILMHVP